MAGSKETPRQKMIGMMYLVLIALLALNVSAEVLKAFENITHGIEKTISIVNDKNDGLMEGLAEAVKNSNNDPQAVACNNAAMKAKEISNELYNYVEDLKRQLVNASKQAYDEKDTEFNTEESYAATGEIIGAKDTDAGNRVLLKGENGSSNREDRKGYQLMMKINKAREDFLGVFSEVKGVTEEEIADIAASFTLQAEDPDLPAPKNEWEYYKFNSLPVGATMALLTGIQNDVKSAESDVINNLASKVGATKRTVDELVPVIKARKSAVAVGEKYEAEIFLSASIKTIDPIVTVDGVEQKVEGGKGFFTATEGAQGTKNRKVEIKIKDPKTGKIESYKSEMVYDVFKAPAIISADKMNVIYIGLDNPISISVPGFEPSQVQASCSNSGWKSLGNGQYIATPRKLSKKGATVSVSVKTDGGSKSVGSTNFRIKRLPKPIANINGKEGGDIGKAEIKFFKAVRASMGSGFAFEGIKYKVTGYEATYVPKKGAPVLAKAKGKSLPGQVSAKMQAARTGDRLIISNVKAQCQQCKTDKNVTLSSALLFTVK